MLVEPDPSTLPAIEDVIQAATIAHAGQTDLGGQPYILHVLRVMLKQSHPVCRLISLMHDVVEDCYESREEGLRSLREVFGYPDIIVDGVDSLTHRDHEPYNVYIERVALNPWAVPVKIADLMDNMDVNRLPAGGVLINDNARRQERYHKALTRLMHGRSTTDLVQISL